MKGCSIQNCLFAGAEARKYGNLMLEDCSISDCRYGVAAWEFASNVRLERCDIFNNKGEGIITTEDYTYDTPTRMIVKECKNHHNQLGMSLAFSRTLDVRNNTILSNKSWGIALRNANIVNIQGNDIFRNDCGGIRVCLNRSNETIIMSNRIHDHTGPGLIKTVLFTEIQETKYEEMAALLRMRLSLGRVSDIERQQIERSIATLKGPDREANSKPVISLDNLFYNNELRYKNISDLRSFVDIKCNLCNRRQANI